MSLLNRHTQIELTMRLRRTVLNTQLSRHDAIYRSVTQTRAMESVRVYVSNNNYIYCGPYLRSRREPCACPSHSPPPQDLSKSERGHETAHPKMNPSNITPAGRLVRK